ncbi:MAG: hypothetical protein LBT16_05465 [Treponema sp.]|nr:hypothetical protein [Treponema sp.]
MKRKGFGLGILAAALTFGMVFMGCATSAKSTANIVRYDTDSPIEQDCTIAVSGAGPLGEATRIISFDGKTVDWKGSYNIVFQSVGEFQINIPAGKHTLEGVSGMGASFQLPPSSSGTAATYDFLAGHTYSIKLQGALQITGITK